MNRLARLFHVHDWVTVEIEEIRPLVGQPYQRLYQQCSRCPERRMLAGSPDERTHWEKWLAGDVDRPTREKR